jgi:hypothetical protein
MKRPMTTEDRLIVFEAIADFLEARQAMGDDLEDVIAYVKKVIAKRRSHNG